MIIESNEVRLTKNEKRTLKLLLENAKISDSVIASILKISNQAVGKIRRKLERTIIDSYSVNLNYEKRGIHTFALGFVKLTSEGSEKNLIDIEQTLLDDTHIISVYRLPSSETNYVVLYGFRDMKELDCFFHSKQKKKALHSYFQNKELHVFSNLSLLKDNPLRLFLKVIDNLDSGFSKVGFNEDSTFKSWD